MPSLDLSKSTTLSDLQFFVSTVAGKCPALQGRALSAVAILTADLIAPIYTGPSPKRFSVKGSALEPYSVDLGAETEQCDCADFVYRGGIEWNGRHYCKHTLAALAYCAFLKASARKARGTQRFCQHRRPAVAPLGAAA